jgi:hypothetical protein
MGCAGFSAESFSWALSWREKPERAPKVEAIRKGGIAHRASLLQFPIIRNQLSSDPWVQWRDGKARLLADILLVRPNNSR